MPYVDERAAEELFQHKVLGLLRGQGLLSQERIDLLESWRRSGFSVHNRVYAHPRDGRDFEALVRYMMRSPISLRRLLQPGTGPAPQGRGEARGPRLQRDLTRARPPTAGAGGAEASLGESDPASVRGGPTGVPSMWKPDARRELHHRAEGTQAHRGPSSQGRPARAPSSSPRTPAGGQPCLRFAPSEDEQDGGMGGVVGRDVTHGSHAVPPCRLTARRSRQRRRRPRLGPLIPIEGPRRGGGPKSNPL